MTFWILEIHPIKGGWEPLKLLDLFYQNSVWLWAIFMKCFFEWTCGAWRRDTFFQELQGIICFGSPRFSRGHKRKIWSQSIYKFVSILSGVLIYFAYCVVVFVASVEFCFFVLLPLFSYNLFHLLTFIFVDFVKKMYMFSVLQFFNFFCAAALSLSCSVDAHFPFSCSLFFTYLHLCLMLFIQLNILCALSYHYLKFPLH